MSADQISSLADTRSLKPARSRRCIQSYQPRSYQRIKYQTTKYYSQDDKITGQTKSQLQPSQSRKSSVVGSKIPVAQRGRKTPHLAQKPTIQPQTWQIHETPILLERIIYSKNGIAGKNVGSQQVVRTIYMPNEGLEVLKLIIQSLRNQLEEHVSAHLLCCPHRRLLSCVERWSRHCKLIPHFPVQF